MTRHKETSYVYFHGFDSSGNMNNPKVQLLSTLGKTVVVNYNSFANTEYIQEQLHKQLYTFCMDNECIFVGTSLGGYWASRMANLFGVPFVAINPAVQPHIVLKQFNMLNDNILKSYEENDCIGEHGSSPGMIVLDMNDDIISSEETFELLKDRYRIDTFKGGNHRFAHMQELLPEIKKFANNNMFLIN